MKNTNHDNYEKKQSQNYNPDHNPNWFNNIGN